jgi:ABC-type Fe3+-hydroxamate transport system substrate-binding protein
MPLFTDQTGHTFELAHTPQRIISLVPSITELLAYLGLHNEVIGITKFCIYPDEWFRTKTHIGGTKQVKIDLVHQLQPHLIIANKEENVKDQIDELAKYYPVYISDVNTLEDTYEMIEHIGSMTGTLVKATELIKEIKSGFDTLKLNLYHTYKTAYLIWRDPYMTVGRDTFIHSIMELAGFKNVFAGSLRYPEVTVNDLKTAGCELLLLSSEPFPFRQKHIDELQPQLPGVRIELVKGEMFSWYGVRPRYAPGYLFRLNREIGG